MEASDRELIRRVIEVTKNPRLRKLWERHEQLDQELKQFDHCAYLTTPELETRNRLKITKLEEVDEMLAIAHSYHR